MNWYLESINNATLRDVITREAAASDKLKAVLTMIAVGLLGVADIAAVRNWLSNKDIDEQVMMSTVGKTRLEDIKPEDVDKILMAEYQRAEQQAKTNAAHPSAAHPSHDELMQMISYFEGISNSVYKDSEGNPTIGIGFNLNKPGAKNVIRSLGADYNAIVSGRAKLSQQQMSKLFILSIAEATTIAKEFTSNYESLPKDVKKIVIDMAFNMGSERLNKFVNLNPALENRQFYRAAYEMKHSKWYGQVGRRSAQLVQMMIAVGDQEKPANTPSADPNQTT